VDDEPSVRRYLARLLGGHDNYCVETFASAEELLQQDKIDRPGCLILDVFLADSSGLDLQRTLGERFDCLPVVFISGRGDIPMSVQAMRAGALDFLTKPLDADKLFAAVERAVAVSEQRCAENERRALLRQSLGTLTRRERDVIRLVAAGRLNKQIAAELDIVEKTVKVHRARAMQKLGLRSVPELVRLTDQLDTL
jgi:RNA polymerase sigma factor (sigma-70 family)